MFPSQFAKIFLTYQTFVTNLHLLRVELVALQVARGIEPCVRSLINRTKVDFPQRFTKRKQKEFSFEFAFILP